MLLLEQSDDRTAIKSAAGALAELAKSNPDNKAAVREAKGIQVDPSLHWLQLAVSRAGALTYTAGLCCRGCSSCWKAARMTSRSSRRWAEQTRCFPRHDLGTLMQCHSRPCRLPGH